MEHMYVTFEATNGKKTIWEIAERVKEEELFGLVRSFNDNKRLTERIVAHCCTAESLVYEYNVSDVEDLYSVVDVWDSVEMAKVRSVLTGEVQLEPILVGEDND